MSDASEKLRSTLERLHEQLGDAKNLDGEVRTLLRETLDEIAGALERPSERDSGEPSLSQRLGDLTQHFEESHPTLAAAVGRVVDALANLGI